MVPYYALFFIVFLFTVFDFVQLPYVRILALLPLCLLLAAFAGLRGLGVDNDGIAYQEAFHMAGELSWIDLLTGNYTDKMERGYLLFNKLVYVLGGNIHVVFLTMALLTGLLNFILIWKLSPMPFFSVLVYVCFFFLYRDFTQIRYALTAAIGMWAIFFFNDRRYMWSAASIVFAAFFHMAVWIVPLFFVLFFFIRNYLFYVLLPILGLIIGFLDPIRYLFELGGLPPVLAGYVEQDQLGRGGYMLSGIAQIFILLLFFYRGKLLEFYQERMVDLFMTALSLGSFINLMFISFSIMQRLSSLLFAVIVFVIPFILSVLEDDLQSRNLGLFLRFIFMAFVLYYGFKMINIDLVRPYSLF